MARVPYVNRDDLDLDGQVMYDRIRNDRNSPEVGLQFRALMNRPKPASYLTSLGAELRFHSTIPDRVKELVIILVAREWNSDIEWTGHSILAAQAGISDETIEGIRTNNLDCLTENEKTIASFVQQMLLQKEVSDDVYSAVHSNLGSEGVVDLTLTVCYYTAVSLAQIALRPEMDGGRVSTL
mgnify:CR=1 FL=1